MSRRQELRNVCNNVEERDKYPQDKSVRDDKQLKKHCEEAIKKAARRGITVNVTYKKNQENLLIDYTIAWPDGSKESGKDKEIDDLEDDLDL